MLVQILNRKSVKQPIASFFLLVFFLWSCQKSNYQESGQGDRKLLTGSHASSQKSAAKINYSADELFRGIMFGDGKVASVIPEIKNFRDFVGITTFNTQEKEAVKILQESIMTELKTTDPAFLAKFKSDIQSGNQLVIFAAIKRGSVRVNEILLAKNRGLANILDNSKNTALTNSLKTSGQMQKIKSLLDHLPADPGTFTENLDSLSNEVGIDRGVILNSITNINMNINSALDLNNATNMSNAINIQTTQNTATENTLNMQTSVQTTLAQIFDHTNINYALDNNLYTNLILNQAIANNIQIKPGFDVAIDIEVLVWIVVAAAVAVVAVALLVFGVEGSLKDNGHIFPEQLVNSIAVTLAI